FQDIVPLNAGNVLGTEDNGPAKKWLALIQKTLNTLPITSNGFHALSTIPNPIVELNSDFDGSVNQKVSSFSLSQSMRISKSELAMQHPKLEPRYSVCDQAMFGNRPSDYDQSVWSSDEDSGPHDSFNSTKDTQIPYCGSFSLEERDKHLESTNSKYCLVASKQMVGIYLTVWVKSDLRDDVHNMKVSCVGRGLMGYLGNKVLYTISDGVFNWNLEELLCFGCHPCILQKPNSQQSKTLQKVLVKNTREVVDAEREFSVKEQASFGLLYLAAGYYLKVVVTG
ncbi:type I inositol polyphosphate 5-phosphatase 4, partial [Tanacetum coccineum]